MGSRVDTPANVKEEAPDREPKWSFCTKFYQLKLQTIKREPAGMIAI
jgi:hypothetical protein